MSFGLATRYGRCGSAAPLFEHVPSAKSVRPKAWNGPLRNYSCPHHDAITVTDRYSSFAGKGNSTSSVAAVAAK
jgi:hypothetical protein